MPALPDRVVQICDRLTPTRQEVTLYSPFSYRFQKKILRYNGFLSTLRATAYINSLQQLRLPPPNPMATPFEQQQLAMSLTASPQIGLGLYLRKFVVSANINETTQEETEVQEYSDDFEIAIIPLYNNQPFYQVGLNEYFSDLELFPIQYGFHIYCRIVDLGFGILTANIDKPDDYVTVYGSVLEKGSYLLDTDFTPYDTMVGISP